MSKKKFRQNRKPWFRAFKQLIKLRYKKPDFVYLGEKPENGSIILSNHLGAASPLNLEVYADFPVRMWGTYEMNSGFKMLYKYQTRVYYNQKRHWNLHLARLFCLIASPLTHLFYKGLNLISTYPDSRLLNTIKESVTAVCEKGENIVIYPENSDNGYFKVLERFHAGFALLAEALKKLGKDVKIFVAYFRKKERKFIFDKPVLFSELKAKFTSRREMADYLLQRCNALGQ